MMMRNTNVVVSLVLPMCLMFSGCCSNYATYANSMAADLDALTPTYTRYVLEDGQLSDADHAARLSILKEMKEKTAVAQKDTK